MRASNRYMNKTIKGKVIHGAKLGRQLGFPTANINASRLTDIDNGVYAARLKVGGRLYKAMANIGIRPSVDGRTRLLEIHLFDYRGNLYGRYVKINLLRKIRDERRFDSINELREQLLKDAHECNR